MDFESRFQFETNLPPPRQISTIKRRKSFSEKFFKKTGVQLKLAGKSTLRIRQKFALKERAPSLQSLYGGGNSCRSNPTTPQEISDVLSQNSTDLSFPSYFIAKQPEETLVNATSLSSEIAAAASEWVIGPSLTDSEPIVLSSNADSYLPVSSNASFITLQRKRDKSPILLTKQPGDKFDTFKRSDFVLKYESDAPTFSSINKNHINKSVANGSIKFNVSSADTGCSFNNSSYDAYPSLESNPRLSITSPTLNSLKSFDSSKSPLAKSTPVLAGRDSNKLGVTRANFTCRVIPNNRSNTSGNGHRNSCSYGPTERESVDIKLNRHSICDIPIKDMPFTNNEFSSISNISPISNTGINSFQQELMSRCSRLLPSCQSKPILSTCTLDKTTALVEPILLKNHERSPHDSQMMLHHFEKEINNNSVLIADRETSKSETNLKDFPNSLSHRPVDLGKPDSPCKPDISLKPDISSYKPPIPNCKPQIATCKPQVPTCKPQVLTCKPQIQTCKPQVPICKPQISNSKPQIPTYKPQISTYKPQISTCKPQVPSCRPQIATCKPQMSLPPKLDIFPHLSDELTQEEVQIIKPKPILKSTQNVEKPLKIYSKIPLDNILKKQLENRLNDEKSVILKKSDSLYISQSLKVREMVATFNSVLKLPQYVYDEEDENFRNSTGKESWIPCNPNGLPLPLDDLCGSVDFLHKEQEEEDFHNLTGKESWIPCNPNGLPLPLDALCGSVDFLRKRSLIEDKLPNMMSLIGHGSSSLRTKI